jgi:hypothetical protein
VDEILCAKFWNRVFLGGDKPPIWQNINSRNYFGDYFLKFLYFWEKILFLALPDTDKNITIQESKKGKDKI